MSSPETRPQRLDPALAHRIDGRTLLHLLPNFDQRYLSELRREFALYLQAAPRRARTPLTCWQDAWNDWTGARPRQAGLISLRLPRCPDCTHGVSHRNISRNLSRTGNPHICGTCRGSGKGSTLRQNALYAPPPAPEPTQAPDGAATEAGDA